MRAIYESRLEERVRFAAVTIASYGDDDGTNIWPTVRTLAKDLSCSQRAVRQYLHRLSELGVLVADGHQRVKYGLVPRYRIDLAALARVPADALRDRRKAAARSREADPDLKERRRQAARTRQTPCTAVQGSDVQTPCTAVLQTPCTAVPNPLHSRAPINQSRPFVLTEEDGAAAPLPSSTKRKLPETPRRPKRIDVRSGATGAEDAAVYSRIGRKHAS